MARTLYSASPADYFINTDGTPRANATAPVHTAIVGGSLVTDLQDINGIGITGVVADDDATFRFYGENNFKGTYWIEGVGGKRFKADPVDIAARLAIAEAFIATVPSLISTAVLDSLDTFTQQLATNMSNHLAAANPHPQYMDLKGTAAGASLWGANAVTGMPTPAQGLLDGDYIAFEG